MTDPRPRPRPVFLLFLKPTSDVKRGDCRDHLQSLQRRRETAPVSVYRVYGDCTPYTTTYSIVVGLHTIPVCAHTAPRH